MTNAVTEAMIEAAEAAWNACRRQVYLLSEDYIERTHALKGPDSVEGNFYRGQYDVAKSFAKAFSSFEARDCSFFKKIDFDALVFTCPKCSNDMWHHQKTPGDPDGMLVRKIQSLILEFEPKAALECIAEHLSYHRFSEPSGTAGLSIAGIPVVIDDTLKPGEIKIVSSVEVSKQSEETP